MNNPICVARFCRLSYEYADSCGFNTVACSPTVPTMSDWARFVLTVKERFGIQIEDKHRPTYVQDCACTPQRKLTKAEWALLEVADGITRGADLRDQTGMTDAEGDAIVAYVKRLRVEHYKEWINAEWVDMMSSPD